MLTGMGPGEVDFWSVRSENAAAAELGVSFPRSCQKLSSRSCLDLATSERMQIVNWAQNMGVPVLYA